MAASPGGDQIASGGDDRAVHVWDVASGRLVRSFTSDVGRIRSLAFDSTGTRLACADDRAATVWDLVSGEPVWRCGAPTGGFVTIAASPIGPMLATADFQGVRLWDVTGGGVTGSGATGSGATGSDLVLGDNPVWASGGHDGGART
nr:hypothetical protein [Micromonospora sp. DSM 115978]